MYCSFLVNVNLITLMRPCFKVVKKNSYQCGMKIELNSNKIMFLSPLTDIYFFMI